MFKFCLFIKRANLNQALIKPIVRRLVCECKKTIWIKILTNLLELKVQVA